MNIIDLIVIIVLGAGFALGWFKGFVATVLNVASFFLAWIIAFFGYAPLSGFINSKTDIANTLLYYTAGAEKLADPSLGNINVATLAPTQVTQILSDANLPGPIANLMQKNILNQAFMQQGLTSLSDYFNRTIINLGINLISFILIYIAVRLIFMLIIGATDKIVKLPVLKQADTVLGGAFGLLQAAMLLFIVFSVVPIAMAILPLDNLNNLLQHSLLGQLFYNGNIITNVLKGII